MMVLLPLTFWLLGTFTAAGDGRSWREAGLLSFTWCGVAVLASTQLLSLFGLLTAPGVALSWVLALLALAIWGRARVLAAVARVRAVSKPGAGTGTWAAAVVIAVFAVGALASALLYPPTNADSLAYHMPRVFFWLQNHSVAAYPPQKGVSCSPAHSSSMASRSYSCSRAAATSGPDSCSGRRTSPPSPRPRCSLVNSVRPLLVNV